MDRIKESELVLPSLYLMVQNGGTITTSSLIAELTSLLKPKGIDAATLPNRNDTYFSQKVRNLKSHDKFERDGYAMYRNEQFEITDKGREAVKDNLESIEYLLSQDFDTSDVCQTFGKLSKKTGKKPISYQEYISEGQIRQMSTTVRERSRELRDAAIEHFSEDGTIKCHCCGFEFESFYGPDYGDCCIEIHHKKPICSYDDNGVEQTIAEALSNLVPVCPNCHRVIHKKHLDADGIESLKKQLSR